MTVTLSWGASTDNVGVAGYQLYFGSFFLGTFSDTSLALIGFKTGTPYVFTVKAVDAAGNVSVASNATTVLLQPPPDTTPPSAPSNLTATSIGSTTVSLRWSASTDDVGVVVYQIYAGTALVGTIPSSTSGTASKLTPGTTYGFTVKAVDAAGNVSQASSSITVTTSGSAVDVVSPSTPIGLSAASTGPTVRTLEDAGGGGGDSSSPLWVNIGGSATGSFVADTGFSGGSTYTSSAMVTSPSSVVSAAVFQSERYGDFTYTLGGYVPGSSWIVTLYFAETYLTAAGQRSFDVSINGAKVLTGFDIYAAAGGANIGVAKSFSVSADSGGRFGIGFATGSVEKPKVNAISITRDPVPVGGGSGSFNP
jgi:chitinase